MANPTIKRIGVLTGGGDCPGLNPVIRAVVRKSCAVGLEVVGIKNGWKGLVENDTIPLDMQSVSGIVHRGGTILNTSRTNPYKDPKQLAAVKENYQKLKLDALIAIGGEDTLGVANKLVKDGFAVVGVPKTIDNDLPATEVTFGFDTALHVATDAVDRLHTTAESHHRVMVIEVMGRDTGWIALHAGLAGGADVILIPEIPFTIENICEAIRQRELSGRKFSLVVVAEGARLPKKDARGKLIPTATPGNVASTIAYSLRESLRKEVRVTVLGHVQRGGSPSPFDRILATRFGVRAVDLVARGEFGRMVCLRAGKIESVSLEEAIGVCKTVDPNGDHVRAARAVGITFGDRP